MKVQSGIYDKHRISINYEIIFKKKKKYETMEYLILATHNFFEIYLNKILFEYFFFFKFYVFSKQTLLS